MSKLVELLKTRQGEKAVEDFAHELGLRRATRYAYYRGDRSIGVSVACKLVKYFYEQGDNETINALGAFVLGIGYTPPIN